MRELDKLGRKEAQTFGECREGYIWQAKEIVCVLHASWARPADRPTGRGRTDGRWQLFGSVGSTELES